MVLVVSVEVEVEVVPARGKRRRRRRVEVILRLWEASSPLSSVVEDVVLVPRAP